jgi:hypothetical protein
MRWSAVALILFALSISPVFASTISTTSGGQEIKLNHDSSGVYRSSLSLVK